MCFFILLNFFFHPQISKKNNQSLGVVEDPDIETLGCPVPNRKLQRLVSDGNQLLSGLAIPIFNHTQ